MPDLSGLDLSDGRPEANNQSGVISILFLYITLI
jgi:hypothetical protein